jgi:hypothetical protein
MENDMSHKRLIDNENESYYHVIIKICDRTDRCSDYALADAHKKKLHQLFFWLESIYSLDCLGYCLMSTHAHFILRRRPKLKLSQKEIAKRHQSYYGLKWALDARSREVIHFGKRLNDLSHFIGDLEKRFTHWYNKQFKITRRGSLWNPRYKSVLLESELALERCLQYVELNPVRAGMVIRPEDYHYCSWFEIMKGTKLGHLLKQRIIDSLRSLGGGINQTPQKLFEGYEKVMELMTVGLEMNPKLKGIYPELEIELLHSHHFWSDAYVIGSESGCLNYQQGKRRRLVS